MIVGSRVRLRPIERADLPQFVAWLGDPAVHASLALVAGLGLAQEERWFEATLGLPAAEQPMAIEARDGESAWRLVGSIGTHGIDWRNRSSEVGLVVGDQAAWGRGLGTEAMRLLLGHLFSTLNLHRVWLRVFADNARAIRMYERLGFRLEGRQRDGDFREGSYRDVLLYAVLAPEWFAAAAPGGKP